MTAMAQLMAGTGLKPLEMEQPVLWCANKNLSGQDRFWASIDQGATWTSRPTFISLGGPQTVILDEMQCPVAGSPGFHAKYYSATPTNLFTLRVPEYAKDGIPAGNHPVSGGFYEAVSQGAPFTQHGQNLQPCHYCWFALFPSFGRAIVYTSLTGWQVLKSNKAPPFESAPVAVWSTESVLAGPSVTTQALDMRWNSANVWFAYDSTGGSVKNSIIGWNRATGVVLSGINLPFATPFTPIFQGSLYYAWNPATQEFHSSPDLVTWSPTGVTLALYGLSPIYWKGSLNVFEHPITGLDLILDRVVPCKDFMVGYNNSEPTNIFRQSTPGGSWTRATVFSSTTAGRENGLQYTPYLEPWQL
jgi:hypothetical protein